MKSIKSSLFIVSGFLLCAVGVLFILLPGPAIIFIPLGLALLSTKYVWAQKLLKKSQRTIRNKAVKLDGWLLKKKHRE
ncbi:PGPGW domain-containing protein [Thalassotalea sediminis]|uniref:PGPGW domain-containing protein n=1 Tax=Thalassotalea sediminis TaxID=1759089 RepID=UPI0025731843|nr:PGPGW domain-containing protein [Thalassotalea sediminis]